MKSLTLQLRITGKRLEYLRLLARTLDDEKRLKRTASKLFGIALDKAGRAVEDCISEAKGENDEA